MEGELGREIEAALAALALATGPGDSSERCAGLLADGRGA